jgi:rare lipoprotein A
MMGLALSVSAQETGRDGSIPSKPKSPNTQVAPKAVRASSHTSRRWFQIGVASWYGSHFQGRTTAAGERFDMNLMTCAHPTLPMGTWLKVTNLKNHRTAFVRVNDRGPVLDSRIVDLSFAAARTLGLGGVGRVKLEMVRMGDPDLAKELVAQLQLPVLFAPVPR